MSEVIVFFDPKQLDELEQLAQGEDGGEYTAALWAAAPNLIAAAREYQKLLSALEHRSLRGFFQEDFYEQARIEGWVWPPQ